MAAETLALIFLTIVIGLLLFVYRKISPRKNTDERPAGRVVSPGKKLPCPLCGTALEKGETVHSCVYRVGSDSLSHIFGCPHCSPVQGKARTGSRQLKPRNCPVCRQTIPPEGYLVARMFEKKLAGSDGKLKIKTHVHVLGCTECRKR